MIEIQIKNKELYEELKKYANYHSDITKVCSFRDEMSELLKGYNLDLPDVGPPRERKKPLLTIQGRNIMKLENANAELLHYVGVRSEFDPTIPLSSMDRVDKIIKNNIVDIDDKFKTLYGKISYRNKINDLICANIKFYGKGKLTDFIDGTLTIQSMGVNDVKQTKINYKQLKLVVTDSLVEDAKHCEIKCVIEDTTQKVTLKFYLKSAILKSIAYKGNKINVATSKIIESNNGDYLVNEPIILPENLVLTEDFAVSPIKRTIPADLFRNAYFEFNYRYNS